MASSTTHFLPSFDFSAALALSPLERMRAAVAFAEKQALGSDATESMDMAVAPMHAASDAALHALEQRLGEPLPPEYHLFLRHWRYMHVGSGCTLWSFAYQGISFGTPWISEEHRPSYRYLVCGDYWKYADGDQLLIDLTTTQRPVVLYLHEHGGLIAYFAPSFSLAVWRMLYEQAHTP